MAVQASSLPLEAQALERTPPPLGASAASVAEARCLLSNPVAFFHSLLPLFLE